MPMPGTTKQRLARLEETMLPVLIEIGALAMLFNLMLDFDHFRSEDRGGDPLRFLIEEELEETLAGLDLETEETDEWKRARTACAAMEIILQDRVAEEAKAFENDNGPE